MKTLILWLPRIAGILMALFLAMFALDSLREPFPRLLLHLLPALLVVAIVAVAWTRPAIGAAAFAICAIGYGVMTRRVDWFLAIGLPLLIVAALYVLDARISRHA